MSYFIFHCYSGELKRKDDLLASMDKKQDEAREKMQEVTILLIIHLFRKNYLYWYWDMFFPCYKDPDKGFVQVQMQMQKLQAAPN